MKRTLNILTLTGLLISVSCIFNPPDFPITPSITFAGIRWVEVAAQNKPDSLFLSIDFRDGDGDIGIDGTENFPPFNERWFYLKTPKSDGCENGLDIPCRKVSFIDETNLDNYVTYSMRGTTPGYDTLPEFKKPYDCQRYFVLKNDNNTTIDTFYTELNPRYFNIYLDIILVNASNGRDSVFSFNRFPYPNCELYGLNGRVPILAKDKDVSVQLPLEGTITYKITSTSLTPIKNKKIRLRFYILDRAGHVSNVDESDEFIIP
jgi:hypothetical protein